MQMVVQNLKAALLEMIEMTFPLEIQTGKNTWRRATVNFAGAEKTWQIG
jgi:hypothetical protein